MSYKKTEEVITDYFNELLDEGTDRESTAHEGTAHESTARESTSHKSTADKEAAHKDAKPKDESKSDASSVKEGDAAALLPEPVPQAKAAKTEQQPIIENSPATEAVSNKAVTNTDASLKKHELDKAPEAIVKSKKPCGQDALKTNNTPAKTPEINDTEQKSVESVKPEDKELATAAYDQHKQRLEKMLQQVSAVEATAETKTTTVDTQAPHTQPLDQADVQSEVNIEEAEQLEYAPLPPLSSEWLENGRPNWAQEQFDILLIEVNGLQLAVPLVALGQIQPMDDNLTPLFGQSDWFMGLQQSPAGSIKTVNTAKFVMPERYQDEHDYQYVVSINGLNWGLAVDRIHQPISIDPDSIRWRAKRSSRPWMAGMVKDHMCVLLDIPSMGEVLQKQDKNHPQSTGG